MHLLTQSMVAFISLDSNAKDARDFFNDELSTFWATLNDHSGELMQKTDKPALAKLNVIERFILSVIRVLIWIRYFFTAMIENLSNYFPV